jgi:hypothetical protein
VGMLFGAINDEKMDLNLSYNSIETEFVNSILSDKIGFFIIGL